MTTQPPDPRIDRMKHTFPLSEYSSPLAGTYAFKLLVAADAADRAAGVIRVRTDDATVEKGAAALYAAEGFSNWHESCAPNYYRQRVRAVLEALVTP